MTATAFDTLKTAEMLTAAGIEDAHAEAITAAMRDAVTEGVATKTDIANLENRMLKVAIAVVAAQTVLTVGLLKLPGAETAIL